MNPPSGNINNRKKNAGSNKIKKFTALINSIEFYPIPTIIINSEFFIIADNKLFHENFRFGTSNKNNVSFPELFTKDQKVEIIKNLNQSKKTKSDISFSLSINSEKKKIFSKTIIKHIKDGNKSAFLLTFLDITTEYNHYLKVDKQIDFYKSLIDQQNDFVVRIKPDQKVLFVNQSYLRTFGGTEKDHIGKTFINYVHPQDRKNTIKELKKIELPPHEVLYAQRTKSVNGYIWVEWSAKGLTNAKGKVVEILGIGRDCTKQMNANLMIKENEENFKHLIDSVPHLAIQGFDSSGILFYWNRASEKLYGYSRDEAIGKNIIELIVPPEMQDDLKQALHKLGKDFIHTSPIEYEFQRKDGTKGHVLTGYVFMESSKNGTLIYAVDIDLTEKKKHDEFQKNTLHKLSASEEQFRTITENTFDLIALLDLEGRHLYCSSSYQSILGYDPEALKGTPSFDLIDPEDRPLVLEKFYYSIINDIQAERITARVIDSNGSTKWIDYRAKLINDKSNEPVSILVIGQDVTDRRKVEEKLKYSELRIRLMFENMKSGVAIYQAVDEGEDFIFKEFNLAAEKITSTERINVIGKKISAVFPEMVRTKLFFSLQEVWRTGQAIYMPPFFFKDNHREGWRENRLYQLPSGEVVAIFEDVTERMNTMNSLIESEERYKAIVEGLSVGIAIHVYNKIVYINSSLRKMMDADDSYSFFGKSVLEFIHPEDIQKVIDAIDDSKNSDSALNNNSVIEERLITLENKIITVEASAIKINYYGKPALMVMLNDITEKKKAIEALSLSEEKFRLIAENTSDGIWFFENGKVKYVSPSYIKLFGYSEEEEINRTEEDVLAQIHPDDLDSVGKSIYGAIQEKKESAQYNYRLKIKNGSYLWREDNAKFLYDENGNYYGVYVVARDITERKNAEEAIIKLSKGLEQSPASIVITDLNGNIEYVNPKFTEISGYSSDEVIGKNPRILKSYKKTDQDYRSLWETISTGNEWRGEFLNIKKNGEEFWEYASISPIKNEKGIITHFIAVKEEITERKKMEQDLIRAKEIAEKSNKLKSEFLAQISHEIRSPINVITSYVSLLRDELENKIEDDLFSSFESIDNAGRRIIRTIDLILNMSELQLGTYEINKNYFDIFKLCSDLISEYKRQAKNKNIDLIFKNNLEDTKIFSDYYAVYQIAANLIDNALKYTEQGIIKIDLKKTTNDKILIKVSDTGIGIAPDYIKNLFMPFTQEEQGYTRKFEGNGLGLALVKKYCDLIGAEISVQSEKEKGSVFDVLIPVN